MSGIKLISTGSALPVQEVTNFDLEKKVDTSDEWIATRTGIRSRHYCSGDESHLGLCMAAAQQAIQRAGVSPADIGVCLVATLTQDTMTPSAACVLQKELGFAEDTVCFDLNAACAGFVYGLHTAECLLAASPRRYGLVIGCEVLSRITDFTDRSTCVLFGDGAGAAVVRADETGLLGFEQGSDGEKGVVLSCPGRPNNNPLVSNPTDLRFVHMDGQEVYKFAVTTVPASIARVLEKTKTAPQDVRWFVLHQANVRIIHSVEKRLKAGEEKFPVNLDHCANTSAASVPILLDEMNQKGMLSRGDKIVLSGFGAGLTWGTALLEW